MQLTQFTDYSIRVLIYLAVREGEVVSTEQISGSYGISQHHLVKVVNQLGRKGYVEVKRGRGGGIRLAKAAATIRLGEVVREMEPGFTMVECFDCATNTCPITPVCALPPVLSRALRAFLAVLDEVTLADVVADPNAYWNYLK